MAAATTDGLYPLFDGSCVNNPLNFGGQGTKNNHPAYLCRRVRAKNKTGQTSEPSGTSSPKREQVLGKRATQKEKG